MNPFTDPYSCLIFGFVAGLGFATFLVTLSLKGK